MWIVNCQNVSNSFNIIAGPTILIPSIMETNNQLEGIRFSGEDVQVSLFGQLTSLNTQGQEMSKKNEEYEAELKHHRDVTLDSFLFGRDFAPDVLRAVRRKLLGHEIDKRKSTSLELATPACIMVSRDKVVRLEDRIKKYNSLVCMDFHDPENLDWIKETLAQLPYVYYAGISSGKTGVFAIIPIVDTNWRNHELYFNELRRITKNMGLNPSLCGRSVDDLRYQSEDQEPYYNPNCTRFSLVRPGEEQ